MVRAILEGRKTQTRRIAGDRTICPYGGKGDRLWVRENWSVDSSLDSLSPNKLPVGRQVAYRASADLIGKARSAIHMPRILSRITLEITRSRLERIQDISRKDARAEGIEERTGQYRHYLKPDKFGPSPIHSFQTLWEKIHGIESWMKNPLVWVVKFEALK